MTQLNTNVEKEKKIIDFYSHIEAVSNIAVITALVLTILTFIVTYHHSKKTEQIKRIQDIKNNISNANQRMIQDLLSVQEANLDLSDDLVKTLYIPVFESAEWASFLIKSKDIDSNYKEYLKEQLKTIYKITSNQYPNLLENKNFSYLKKVVTRWGIQSK